MMAALEDNSGLDLAHKHGFGDGESFPDTNAVSLDGPQCHLLQNAACITSSGFRVNRKRAPLHHLQVELNDSPSLSKRQCLGFYTHFLLSCYFKRTVRNV